MLFAIAANPAPTNLTVSAKPKMQRLTWDRVPDERFSCINAYRYPSLADANADTNGVFIGISTTRFYRDDDPIALNTPVWYRISYLDIDTNESLKSNVATTSTAGVGQGDTQAPAILAPANVTLVQNNQDMNSDGKIDIACQASCDAAAGAVNYEFEVSRASSSGGAFSVTGLGGNRPQRILNFAANSNFYYKVRARGIAFNGDVGAWSTSLIVGGTTYTFATYAGFKPLPKGLTLPAPNIPKTTAGTLFVGIEWDKVNDLDYSFTEVQASYNSGSTWEFRTTVRGTEYVDMYATPGNYPSGVRYRIRHWDTSNNPTGWFQQNFNTVSALILAQDIDTNAIISRTIASDQILNRHIAADQIGVSQIKHANINLPLTSSSNVATTIPANGTSAVEQITSIDTTDCDFLDVFMCFRATSAHQVQVVLTNGDGSITHGTFPNMALAANEYGFIQAAIDTRAVSLMGVVCRVTNDATGPLNVTNTRMLCWKRKR